MVFTDCLCHFAGGFKDLDDLLDPQIHTYTHTDIYRHTHTHINTHMTGTELESGKWI